MPENICVSTSTEAPRLSSDLVERLRTRRPSFAIGTITIGSTHSTISVGIGALTAATTSEPTSRSGCCTRSFRIRLTDWSVCVTSELMRESTSPNCRSPW